MTQPPPDIHAKAFLQDTAHQIERLQHFEQVHIDNLDMYREQIKEKDAEIERLETELNHFYGLCVDDPGKNPPLFWKDVAAEQKTLIQELVAAMKPFAEEEPEYKALSEDNELWLEDTYGQYRAARRVLAKAKAQGYEP